MAGKKSDKVEKSKRIRTIAEALLQCHGYSDICRNMTERWAVSQRTIERYIEEAFELIKDEVLDIDGLEKTKAMHLKMRLDSCRDLMKFKTQLAKKQSLSKDELSSLVSIEKQLLDIRKDMAKLEGLYIDRMELTGKGGKDLSITMADVLAAKKARADDE